MPESPQIGYVIITDEAPSVTVDRVRSALEESGLDPEEARELAKRHAFARAKNGLDVKGVINKVAENDQRLIYQLDETYVELNRLAYSDRGQIWFDKQALTVGADTPALREEAEKLFAHYGSMYLGSDVTRLVQRIFTKQRGIVSIRRHGGVYFVPIQFGALVDRVKDFAGKMGMRWVVYATGAEGGMREQVLDRLAERIKGELESMKKEIDKKGNDLTPRIAQTRMDTLVAQIGQIREFCAALGATAEEIEALASTTEVDLGLVKACGSASVLAALANQGVVTGLLGKVASKAFEDRPKVRLSLDALASLGSDLKAAGKRGACVSLAALDVLPRIVKPQKETPQCQPT